VLGVLADVDDSVRRLVGVLAEQAHEALFYFSTLYAASWALGYGAHRFVRANSLDRTFRSLRFNNYWYYLLSGELLEFPDYDVAPRPVEGVILTAIVEAGGRGYLYRGLVQDFTYSKTGELDSVLISSAYRRELAHDRESLQQGSLGKLRPDKRFYRIQGDFLVLRFCEIKTLNVDYIWLGDVAEAVSDGGEQLHLNLGFR
jgi:hypothetical protein